MGGTGASGAGSGGKGAGGASGTGSGGTAGGRASGTGGGGGGGATTGTGTCAIPEQPPDPSDCTDFTATGAYIMVQRAIEGDGGLYLPGGNPFVPTGGTLIDGDYDLVQYYGGYNSPPTRRTIRLFNSGTYVEWSIDNDNAPPDGGVTHFRFNSTQTPSGTSLGDLMGTCIQGVSGPDFAYSANGDQLQIKDVIAETLYVYQRRCTR